MNEIDSYEKYINRLIKSPLNTPKNDTLIEMVKKRVTPEEAEFLSKLSLRGMTPRKISKKLGIPMDEVIEKLDMYAKKGLVFRIKGKTPNKNIYNLGDVMFAYYRMPWWSGKKDDYHRDLSTPVNKFYIDDYANSLTTPGPSQGLRSVPVNVTVDDPSAIIPYENLIQLLDEYVDYFSVSPCPCRTRHNLDPNFEESKYPMEVCFHFGDLGRYCDDVGVGRNVTKEEVLEILKKCAEAGLVHAPSSWREGMDTLCNCDPEYCLYTEPIVKLLSGPVPRGLQKSSYIRAWADEEKCIKCGLCAKRCPINAIEFIEDEKKIIFKENRCMGCGVCVYKCPTGAIVMKQLGEPADVSKTQMDFVLKFLKERGLDLETVNKMID